MRGFNKTSSAIAAVIVVSLFSYHLTSTLPTSLPRNLGSYQTSSIRMNSTNAFCSGINRASLSTDSSISKNDKSRSSFKKQVSIDGNQIINAALDNPSSLSTSLSANMNSLIWFVGSFVFGLFLTLTCLPFLQCCCCCPATCPPKCVRHPDQNLYTKCELYWPTIVLLLALGLAASGAAVGLSKASSFNQSTSQIACSITMLPDDFLNGNVSTDGTSYFSGLNTLTLNLAALSSNSTTITTAVTNFVSTNPNVMAALLATNNLLTDTISGDGNSGNGVPPITYGPSVGSQTSLFPPAYGSYNTSGPLYSFYSGIANIKVVLTSISSDADAFIANSAAVATAITTANNIIAPLIVSLNNLDKQISGLATALNYTQYVTTAVQAYSAVVLSMVILCFLGATLMTFCEKHKCRYFMYLTCVFMVIFTIFGFFITTFLSILLPLTSWTCDFLQTAFASQIGFDNNFRTLDSSIRNYASVCMPFGSGDLLTSMGISSLSSLNNLTSLSSYFTTVDITSVNTQITNGVSLLQLTASNYGFGVIPDISNYSKLTLLANPANYAACTDSNFLLDSYVPSNIQNPQYISCATPGNNAGLAQCTPTGFAPKAGSCFGCLDVTRISQLFPAGTPLATIVTTVVTRYSGVAGCTPFATDLANIWQDYYVIKNLALTPIKSALTTIGTDATILEATLSNLQSSFLLANSTFSSISNLVDPSYGLVQSLNCKIFGQDFQRVLNSICGTMFDSFYSTRIVMGISSFGLLFSIVCIACTGPRHYRQSQKKSKVNDSFLDRRQHITVQTLNTTTDKF